MGRTASMLRRGLGRLARSEDGTATLPFVIFMPLYFILVISSLEMGLLMIRHVSLERALDLSVRDLRLGVGQVQGESATAAFNRLKQSVCNRAMLIPNCMTDMHLSLQRLSKTTWQPTTLDPNGNTPNVCLDLKDNPNPAIVFDNGVSNDIMLIRACVRFKPIIPTTGLGASMPKDTSGYYKLFSSSAFVNEPRPGT